MSREISVLCTRKAVSVKRKETHVEEREVNDAGEDVEGHVLEPGEDERGVADVGESEVEGHVLDTGENVIENE